MFLQFTKNGSPIYLRPDAVVALTVSPFGRTSTPMTYVHFSAADPVEVGGDIDVVKAAIKSWHNENAQTLSELLSAEHRAAEEADSRSDCPREVCPVPNSCIIAGCIAKCTVRAASND